MRRSISLLLAILLMLAGSTAAVTASAQDNNDSKAVAEDCRKDGWKTLTDESGRPFRNQGQCVSFARQGGEFRQVDEEPSQEGKNDATEADKGGDEADKPNLNIVDGQEPWNGYLEGNGFAAGEELTKVTFESSRATLNLRSPVGTLVDDDGTFETERIIYWCTEYDGFGDNSGTVTVETSAGETYSQTFEMDIHCGPED